jgi:hypothetical protein
MVSFTRLMKAAIVAALLNREVRQAITSMLTKSINGRMNGTNRSRHSGSLSDLIESILAITMSRSMRGSWARESWAAQPATISAISALLTALLKPKEGRHGHEDRIIDIDDYTIVDEK